MPTGSLLDLAFDAVDHFARVDLDELLRLGPPITGTERGVEFRGGVVDELVRGAGRHRGLVREGAEAILLAAQAAEPAEVVGDLVVRLVSRLVALRRGEFLALAVQRGETHACCATSRPSCIRSNLVLAACDSVLPWRQTKPSSALPVHCAWATGASANSGGEGMEMQRRKFHGRCLADLFVRRASLAARRGAAISGRATSGPFRQARSWHGEIVSRRVCP